MNRFKLPRRVALAGACLLLSATGVQAQAVHTVDVLGIYSNHAAALVADPAALFVSHIEYANRALANSQANYRYNLVHVQQQNWANDASLGSSQLQSFATDATIRALREQYGADMVAGMVPTSSGSCGIAYLPISSDGQTITSYSRDYAYSLSGHSCGGRTMAHEMGHNAGLGHSAAQGSSGTFGYWARGHGVGNSFVTIMAYNGAYGVYSSSGRLQVHANPNISICQGQPCGVDYTLSNGADAVRALNMASSQLEAYTDSITPGPQNLPPEAVAESATTDQGQAVSMNVLANDTDPDGDALTLVSVTQPSNGAATVLSPSGSVRYEPNPGFWGEDQFSYTVRDAVGATASAGVNVTVNEVDDGGGSGGDQNLVINGNLEAGLDGWAGVWSATVALANPALEGQYSLRASGGYGVIGELDVPISGGRRLTLSASLSSETANRVYAYLRILQNGSWRYQYVTGADLTPGGITQLRRSFDLLAGDVSSGSVLFYFPSRMQGDVLIDQVQLTSE